MPRGGLSQNWFSPVLLVLSGGVILNGENPFNKFVQACQSLEMDILSFERVHEPAVGVVLIAKYNLL
jgi:hypothetical protein